MLVCGVHGPNGPGVTAPVVRAPEAEGLPRAVCVAKLGERTGHDPSGFPNSQAFSVRTSSFGGGADWLRRCNRRRGRRFRNCYGEHWNYGKYWNYRFDGQHGVYRDDRLKRVNRQYGQHWRHGFNRRYGHDGEYRNNGKHWFNR